MRQQAVLIENCLKDTIDRHIKLTAFDDLLGNSILGENSKCAYPVYKEGFRYIWNRKQGKEIKLEYVITDMGIISSNVYWVIQCSE